ncbi:MAG: class I SAM-dependent methyltransferase [Candidatus Latescibacteria bacterium]|nr:class I SAM-dependent methyltransferase [Candidatus Latescibacterota bacterium]
MTPVLPEIAVPSDLAREEMPDLLRHWYLGSRARRHMMMRRFMEVDRHLELAAGRRVLDVGSAWGFNVMALNALGFHAVGVDIVPDPFVVGKRIAEFNRIPFDVAGADARALPFGNARFDHVTLVETFEHIFAEDRPRAMAECFRVLRPGGRIVLSTPNHASLVERAKRVAVRHRWLRARLPSMCYPDLGTKRDDYHPYRYHRPLPDREIVALLEGAGFRVNAVSHFLFMLKSTPDSWYGPWTVLERTWERTPGVGALAATACVVASKPS